MGGATKRRMRLDRRGSIAILSALCLTLMLASAAMAIDLAKLYLTKSTDQRIADQSAMAAAFAYGQSGKSTTTAARAASALATSNGAVGATVTTSIVTSPKTANDKAAMVVVTTPVSLSPFAKVAASLVNVSVSATAYAEIHDQAIPCLLALGGSGVSDSGGTNITGTGCSLASNGNVSASQGATVTAQAIYAVGSIGTSGGASINTNPATGQTYPGSSAVPDSYASANVFSRQSTVAALTAPTFPSVGAAPSGGSNITCSGNTTVPAGQHAYVFATYYPTCTSVAFSGGAQETDLSGGLSLQGNAGTNVNVTFAAGVYKMNGIWIAGGGGSNFTATLSLASGVTLYVWNGINVGGTTSLTVNGPGTYYVQGGIAANSGNSVSFTNANNTNATSTFYVDGGITVGSGTGAFPNGLYTITSGGITVGSGRLTFGNGSFDIAGGLSVGGSGALTFGSQLNSSSVFQVDTVNASGDASYSAGALTIGSFANHDFNGAVVVAGNTSLGAGNYTIEGDFNAAQSGGTSITGTGVSIVASGAITFAQGYSNINLSAPTAITTDTAGTASTVVLASNSAAAAYISGGTTNTVLVGALYLPNAALTMAGGANVSGGGGCMIMVANSVALTAGGSMATNCTGVQSETGAGVALVQ